MFNQLKLTRDELFDVLNCEHLSSLPEKAIPKQINLAFVDLRDIDNAAVSQSISSAIDAASSPIEIWWALTGFICFGIAALPITIGIFIASLLLGGTYFYSSYSTLRTNTKELTQFFQLAHLKLWAARELTQQIKTAIKQELKKTGNNKEELYNQFSPHIPSLKKDRPDIQKSNPSTKESIGISIAITSTLLMSYFWGISSIIEALGFVATAAAILSPIGIAIAVIGSVMIGAFMGYKHYQVQKNTAYLQSLSNELNNVIHHEKNDCYALNATLSTLKNTSALYHTKKMNNINYTSLNHTRPLIKKQRVPIRKNAYSLFHFCDTKANSTEMGKTMIKPQHPI